MFHLLKRVWPVLVLLVAGVQSVFGFALLGPINETFQQGSGGQAIGYGLPPKAAVFEDDGGSADVGAPKNYGEGYRWNTRTLYYAYDPSFLDFFGSNGVVAVDAAFAIMNSLSNVSSYSSNLSEWPTKTSRINYRAQSLQLVDVKSAMLGALVEQMGLAQPDRWVWCLHDRDTAGAVCPNYGYIVIQRNFDPVTFTYSSYVNKVFYDYYIAELCPLAINFYAPLFAEAVEFNVDPSQAADSFSAVAADKLEYGQFFTSLTRDDIGGLRSLLATNRMNVEAVEPNSLLLFTNRLSQLLTTSSLQSFNQQALTNNPGALQALFPNLAITSSTNFFTNVVTTNVEAFYTTNGNTSLVLITNLTTNVVTMFDYTFGNVVTNHYYTNGFVVTQVTNVGPNPFAPILITNQFSQTLVTSNLATLTQQALTNPPAAFQALFPDIVITGFTNFFTNLVTTNIEAFYTSNGTPDLVLLTNLTTNVVTEYNYTFANVVTNHFYPNSFVVTQITNAAVNPFAPILFTNQFATLLTTSNLATLTQQSLTNGPAALQALYPGLVINSFTNLFTNQITTNITAFFTNPPFGQAGAAQLKLVTNFTTNVAILFNYTFGNVVTNHLYNKGFITTQTTNVTFSTFGLAGSMQTNVTSKTVLVSNYVNGDFYIVPTNLWGYDILFTQLISVIPVTNVFVVATNSPGVTNVGGQSFTMNIISYFTNYNYITYPIVAFPGPVQTNVTSTTNIANLINGDYYVVPTNLFGYDILSTQLVSVVPITNIFVVATNGPGVTATNHNFTLDVITFATNYTLIAYPIFAFPGPVQTNVTSVTNIGKFVNGDYYIIPPGLFGYDILSTQLVTVVATTNVVVTATNAPGVTGTNLSFTMNVITYATNYTLVEYPIQYVANSVALRQGIEKINFVRRDFDSLLNSTWTPITNFYNLTAVVSNAPFTQTLKRVITQPDIVIAARDETAGPSAPIAISALERSAPNFNSSQAITGLAGPGTMAPPIQIAFNKVGPVYFNIGPFFAVNGIAVFVQTNSVLDFIWGSFDASTNAPIIYPDSTSLADLETQIFFQINASLLPNGSISNNSASNPYVAQLQATGAQAPYTWSLAPNSAGLPDGLTLWPGGVISGVPTTQGTFDFTVQATDVGARITKANFFIQIDP